MSPSDRTTAAYSCRGPLPHEAVHLALQGRDVLVAVIDRCEADVGQLVDVAQRLGGQPADLLGGHLRLAPRPQRALDVVDRLLGPRDGHRPLLERAQQPAQQLGPVEVLAAAVALDDGQPRALGALVGGEPILHASHSRRRRMVLPDSRSRESMTRVPSELQRGQRKPSMLPVRTTQAVVPARQDTTRYRHSPGRRDRSAGVSRCRPVVTLTSARLPGSQASSTSTTSRSASGHGRCWRGRASSS